MCGVGWMETTEFHWKSVPLLRRPIRRISNPNVPSPMQINQHTIPQPANQLTNLWQLILLFYSVLTDVKLTDCQVPPMRCLLAVNSAGPQITLKNHAQSSHPCQLSIINLAPIHITHSTLEGTHISANLRFPMVIVIPTVCVGGGAYSIMLWSRSDSGLVTFLRYLILILILNVKKYHALSWSRWNLMATFTYEMYFHIFELQVVKLRLLNKGIITNGVNV